MTSQERYVTGLVFGIIICDLTDLFLQLVQAGAVNVTLDDFQAVSQDSGKGDVNGPASLS